LPLPPYVPFGGAMRGVLCEAKPLDEDILTLS
jgi:hypothetical protein